MSAPDLSHIRGIIWDLDGTLYRYDHVFVQACNIAAARTAIALGVNMPFEEALSLATHSEKLYGSSFRLFIDHGLKYEDFHAPFHSAVDLTIIQKNKEMKTALEGLDIPMIILTNASREWAVKTLNHLEYNHLFGDGKIISLEDVNFQSKSKSSAGFEKALSIIGVPAINTLMVEDLAHNLPIAKDMGMTTALVHHGKLPEEGIGHVDLFFQDTLELVRVLLDAYSPPDSVSVNRF